MGNLNGVIMGINDSKTLVINKRTTIKGHIHRVAKSVYQVIIEYISYIFKVKNTIKIFKNKWMSDNLKESLIFILNNLKLLYIYINLTGIYCNIIEEINLMIYFPK